MSSTPWYRGKTLPGRSDDWTVESVAHRSIASDETFTCAVTGDEVPANTSHLYVTARRERSFARDEIENFVVVDEETLRDWLGADE